MLYLKNVFVRRFRANRWSMPVEGLSIWIWLGLLARGPELDPESHFNQRIIPKLVHALTNVAFSAVAVAGNQPCQVQRGGVAVSGLQSAQKQ